MTVGERKIKLVQVIADSNLGGGPKNVLGILANIDQKRFECHLICPDGYLAREARRIAGVVVHRLHFRSKTNPADYIYFHKIIQKIQTKDDPFGPLIIHAHGPRAGLVARLFRISGTIYVYTEHIYDANFHLKNRLSEWVQKRILKALNQRTDLVIAVSTSVRDYLVQNDFVRPERIAIVPNGIDFVAPDLGLENRQRHSPPIIGTIGSLNPQKGHSYLVEAMPLLLRKYPLLTLEIIGEGDERENLKRLIAKLKLERHVSLLGKKEDINKYLRHWSAFVLSSVSETFGIVILEAMATGVPVVATEVGGVPDIMQQHKNGFLVPPRDPKALAVAIGKLLDYEDIGQQMAKNGLKTAEEYDWKKVVRRIEELYLKLAGKETER